jgi:hypothetical protein
VLLGVKPQKLDEVAPQLAAALGARHLSGLDPGRGGAGDAARPLPGAARDRAGDAEHAVALGKGVVGLCSDDPAPPPGSRWTR